MNKSEPIRSLESIDLSSCTILDKNFSGVKFNGASFRGTRFDNVDFTVPPSQTATSPSAG